MAERCPACGSYRVYDDMGDGLYCDSCGWPDVQDDDCGEDAGRVVDFGDEDDHA